MALDMFVTAIDAVSMSMMRDISNERKGSDVAGTYKTKTVGSECH